MWLFNFIRKFFHSYIFFLILVLLFFAPFTGFTLQKPYAIFNIVFFIIALTACFLIIKFLKKYKFKNKKITQILKDDKSYKKIVVVSFVLLLILQIFICYGGYFIVGWDTRNVIFPEKQINSDYMSMYTNQLFLAGIFRRIYNLCLWLGINEFNDYYLVLVILSAFSCAICVLLSGFIAKKIKGNMCGISTYFLSYIFIGLNPYIMVPYSDTFAMLATTIVLYIYVCCKNKWIKTLFIPLISVIGYSIKPTAIFVFISILIIESVFFIKNFKFDRKLFKILPVLAILAISIFSGFTIKNAVCNYGVEINENKSFSATHFLMMGVNIVTRGAWDDKDVKYSRSFNTQEEREEANIEKWKERVINLGPLGLMWIFLNKTATNFSDGSFAWEYEKPWMISNVGNNMIVKFIYGIDSPHNINLANNLFSYPYQSIWFAILIGCWLLKLDKSLSKSKSCLFITILAISAFLTIFEPDPRYLLLYLPFFCITSILGWYTASKIINKNYILSNIKTLKA